MAFPFGEGREVSHTLAPDEAEHVNLDGYGSSVKLLLAIHALEHYQDPTTTCDEKPDIAGN